MLMLGLELISNEQVAIAELVKNAYDADAKHVLVKLEDEQGSSAQLAVLDDGSGMTLDVVQGTWLEPATPSRRARPSSPTGRRSTGEKGIGRFAVAKLANRVLLETRAQDAGEVHANIDWDRFLDDDAFLDEIEIQVGEREATSFGPSGAIAELWRNAFEVYSADEQPPDGTSGTLLELSPLRAGWDDALAQGVVRALSRLIAPAHLLGADTRPDADFRILLDLPDRLSKYAGWVGPPEELSRPQYTLEAVVEETGQTSLRVSVRDHPDLEQNTTTQLVGVDWRNPRCGPFEFRLYAWDRDTQGAQTSAPGTKLAEFRDLLDQSAGISLYRDGFRVLPYGDEGDDWLSLDRRRINDPTHRLSNNQIIGVVSISRDNNPELIDQTNREGLVDGPALDDMRLMLREMMTVLEAARYDSRPRAPRRRADPNVFDAIKLDDLRAAAESRSDPSLVAMITSAEVAISERSQELREVVSRYQRLATLGQLVDKMIHEVTQPVAAIRQAALAGIETIDDLDHDAINQSSGCRQLIREFSEDFNLIRQQSNVTSEVIRRLAPFGGRQRGRPKKTTVEGAMRDVVRIMQKDIEKREISIHIPDSETVVSVDGTELQEILLNLLTNAIHWAIRGKRSAPRRIVFGVRRTERGEIEILISDSGPGVAESDRDRIFEPYFTKRDGGVGLGLTLVGQIVEDYYGGSLQLVRGGPLPGATFRILLRRRVD